MELTCQKHSLTSASLLSSSGSHVLKRVNRWSQEAAAAKEMISGTRQFHFRIFIEQLFSSCFTPILLQKHKGLTNVSPCELVTFDPSGGVAEKKLEKQTLSLKQPEVNKTNVIL